MSSRTITLTLCALASALVCVGCTGPATSPIPAFSDGGLLRLGAPLPQASHVFLEGHYDLVQGGDLLGPDIVLSTGLNTISLLSGKDAAVAALQAACLSDDRLVMEGHWRYPRSYEVGLIRLWLDDEDRVRELCAGDEPGGPLHFVGHFGHESDVPTLDFELRYTKPLIPYRGTFYSIAHHGPCEASDTCGVAPNTREAIILAERYGANAMEVDVRMTKDGVPILFHDPSVNSSSTRGVFCQGPIASHTFDELQANCRLTHGEQIPSVEQVLDVLLDETLMEGVYLDAKVPEAVAPTALLATQINERAEAQGRDFRALVALTTEEVTDAWLDFVADAADVPPCLMEYDPDLVVELGCVAWGPTWTAGPRADDVAKVRAAGARVIYWTLNDDNFIEAFLRQGRPDGVITGRVGLLMYLYQKIGKVPPGADGSGGP